VRDVQDRQSVPDWAVISAIAAPVVLVASSSAATLLPASRYDPIGQTMSVLAATPRSAPVMTIGFVLTAMCQIVTAIGLHVLRPAPRLLLAFAGGCGLAVAALPVSSHATVGVHLFAAAAGIVTLSIWPVIAISDAVTAPAACRSCWAISASAIFTVLVMWILWETQRGGGLGIAERATVVGETLWPLAVAATARWPSSHERKGPEPVPSRKVRTLSS
jgi:hypothetical protein